MAETIECRCGQPLDITGFEPGQQVRCPSCGTVVTIPGDVAGGEAPQGETAPSDTVQPQAADTGAAAEATPSPAEGQPDEAPPMAMALPDDEESNVRPQGGRALSPMERRRMTQRKASRDAQQRIKRVLVWPSLILGALSIVMAGVGVYYRFFAEKTIEIREDSRGVEHLYAKIEKKDAPGEYEEIEVQPDIMPGDKVAESYESGTQISLNGEPLDYGRGGLTYVYLKDPDSDDLRRTAVKRQGLWFYEVDTESAERPHPLKDLDGDGEPDPLDIPLVAQQRGTMRYVPVTLDGTVFYHKDTNKPVTVQYYRAEDEFQTDPLGTFKQTEPPLGLQPAFFIWSGLPVGALLLLAGFVFLYESQKNKASQADQS